MAARKNRRSRAEVDKIVERIAEMMVGATWIRGSSEATLSKELEVSVSQIRQWSAQASRLAFRVADPTTLNEIRAASISALDRLAVMSEGKGDYRTSVQAIKERAVIAGACVPAGDGPGVASVVINIQKDPSFRRAIAVMNEALLPFPEALAAVNAAFMREAAREKRREESRALTSHATH